MSDKSKIKGQAMPYMLVMLVALVISWAMMVNIAKLLHDRIMMQNAADNAALSVAVYKARTLNYLGDINYRIGALLLDGLLGEELAILNVPFSRSLPIWGLTNYGCIGYYGTAGNNCPRLRPPLMPPALNGLLFVDYNAFYVAFSGYVSQENIQSAYDKDHNGTCTGLDIGTFSGSRNIDAIAKRLKYYLGDKNSSLRGLQYRIRQPFPVMAYVIANDIAAKQMINSKGENCGADSAIVDHLGGSLGLEENDKGARLYSTQNVCISCIEPLPPFHSHLFFPGSCRHIFPKTWLYANRETFSKCQKLTVWAVKKGDSASNRRYPLFGRFLGIHWPTIITTASAAVYNKKGPMFPIEEKGSESDNIIPVLQAYSDARDGGWYAHLVPQKGLIRH